VKEKQEKLIIDKLGPIKHLEIEPRPLTIRVGEQASGKSLAAQVLYFFRGLKSHLGRIYGPDLVEAEDPETVAVRQVLDEMRGVAFGYFANGTANLHYRRGRTSDSGPVDWKVKVHGRNRKIRPLKELRDQVRGWFDLWTKDKESLGETRVIRHVFIPTERSMFTRLSAMSEPSVLYSPKQPLPFRRFSEILDMALSRYEVSRLIESLPLKGLESREAIRYVIERQRAALFGEAYAPRTAPRRWKWRVRRDGAAKILPIEATASGQMEAWPFFAIAATLGARTTSRDFYFEEPETHLHPSAQVEVMKAIAYLINNRQHTFFITTHSPYLLYVVNNMIQRFVSLKGDIPADEERWLNPEDVAAYRLPQLVQPAGQDIVDRKDTQLIDAEELESVANDLGGEFDALLYGME
jgi:hypothetical protein